MTTLSNPLLAHRVSTFGNTIFAEMTQLARAHRAINLAQGFPDFDGPEAVKDAAIAALRGGDNQYAQGIGQPALRHAIAAHARRFYGQSLDPDTDITVTSGATEGLFACILGLVNPGDEVIVLEPAYDSYIPNILMAGGVPRCVPLRAPGWAFDPAELAAAFNPRTRLILLNTPHNPTGRVFTRDELICIANLCQQWNVIAISDEVYEHLVFEGAHHVRLATLPGMAERTLTVSSLGKTFSFTGWKVGWVLGPAALTLGPRRAKQFITFATATPLQAAAALALGLDDTYFRDFAADFQAKRDYLLAGLTAAGLPALQPDGTYFIMADLTPLGWHDDVAFCRWLTTEVGVAAIPPSAFYSPEHKHLGRGWARFAFCKTHATLEQALDRLTSRPLTPH